MSLSFSSSSSDYSLNPAHYNSSCSECSGHVKEMIRIHDLWQASKKELREARRSRADLLAEYEAEVAKASRSAAAVVSGFTEEIDNMRREIKAKSELIDELRNENALMTRSFDDLNSQLLSANERLADQMAALAEAAAKRMEKQEQKQVDGRDEEIFNLRRANDALSGRVAQYENDMKSLEYRLTQAASKAEQEGGKEKQKMNKIIDDLNEAMKTQEQEFAAMKEKIRGEVSLQSGVIEQQRQEIGQLKGQLEDIKSLESLIEQSALGEFRRSRQSLEKRLMDLQSDCSSVASLIAPNLAKLANEGGAMPAWVPSEVNQAIKQFKVNLGDSSRSPASHMTNFLVSLNTIWRDRLHAKVRQLKARYEGEMHEMRRKLDHRIPYEQIVQKARIVRLQKDLDDQRAVALHAKGDANKNLLDLSLSTVENLSKQIIEFEKENDMLKSQINQLMDDKDTLIGHGPTMKGVLVAVNERNQQALNAMGDKIWKNAHAYAERTKKIGLYGKQSAAPPVSKEELAKQLTIECSMFVEALEDNISEARKIIKENTVNRNDKQ